MSNLFSYTCSCCGKVFNGSPSVAFRTPYYYAVLSEDERNELGLISDDLCTIYDGKETDYFIRTVLEIPILGVGDPFMWGVWVSLSEKSFMRYVETFKDPVEGETYFGWFSNQLPYYEDTLSIPTTVIVQADNARPKLWLNREGNGAVHPLVIDQRDGITVEKAGEIARAIGHLG